MTRKLQEGQRHEIVRRFLAGERTESLAAEFGVSRVTILNQVRSAGYRPADLVDGETRTGQRMFRRSVEAQIIADYQSGNTLEELAAKYGANYGTIHNVLERAGIPRRTRGGEWTTIRFSPEERQRAVDLWLAGEIIVDIARALDVNYQVVERELRRAGIDTSRRVHVRSWREERKTGGRSIRDGYVHIWIAADHPMASMRDAAGYVREHRLVMAMLLGRPLLPTEDVHHINGDGLDNAPGNLQLRHGKHGSGAVFRCLDCGSVNIGAVPLGEVTD